MKISTHLQELQKVANRPKIYNPESNRILRKGLWFTFQTTYLRLNGHRYDVKDEQSLNNIGVLLSYFTASEMFLEAKALVYGLNEPSLDKGLLIIGDYGNGKTTTMKAFSDILTRHNYGGRFKMTNARDIVQDYETSEGAEAKKLFWSKYTTPILCIDDVKKERKASNYGISEIVGDVLTTRYNKGLKTYLTCNFAEGDIETDPDRRLRNGLEEFSRYGEHFYDRIFEMFNIIEFKGKSRR